MDCQASQEPDSTSVQELDRIGCRRRFAEGFGGDGQNPEGIADTFWEGGDGVGRLLQTRGDYDPLDGAEGLLLEGIHQGTGIWKWSRRQ